MSDMRRREVIRLLGGVAVAWPLAVRAQRQPVPVVGSLNRASEAGLAGRMAAFRQGLRKVGYVEGSNVTIEYRWADDQYDRVPALAADLVNRRVAVIVATGAGSWSAQAAKAATQTIPVIFVGGFDPVKLGLVASLNRPGGNVTGVTVLSNTLEAKRLGLLHELVPQATRIAALINPANASATTQSQDLAVAARELGLQLHVVNASNGHGIDVAFAELVEQRVSGLLICSDSLFTQRREQLVSLAARHALPTLYHSDEVTKAGGLISYGASFLDAYRQAGIYAGRVLNGEKPADLPVQQSAKFELVINLKTAKAGGLNIPDKLLALADEVIE
jgi:putative ABC transport system substrate-binding protein